MQVQNRRCPRQDGARTVLVPVTVNVQQTITETETRTVQVPKVVMEDARLVPTRCARPLLALSITLRPSWRTRLLPCRRQRW